MPFATSTAGPPLCCGMRVGGGKKLYRIEDIERLLEEIGRLVPLSGPPSPGLQSPAVDRSGHSPARSDIDVDALPLLHGRSWYWCEGTKTREWWCKRAKGNQPLRRIIMGIMDEPPEEIQVAHVDGDPLDCRRDNLILRTITQRLASARKPRTHHCKPCSLEFKGDGRHGQSNSWRAQIRAEEKTHYLGTFSSEFKAAEAYDNAVRKYFGEHAWLNFPDTGECGPYMDFEARTAA